MSRLSESGADVGFAAARAWRRGGLVAIAAALALWAPAAMAQRCNKLTASDLVFTGYTPFGVGVAATTTITFLCPTPVDSAAISISAPRQMTTTAGDALQFQLYADASRLTPWPVGSSLPVTPSRAGAVTVYAFLPPQDAAAGTYAGALTVAIQTPNQTDTTVLAVSAVVADACVIDPGALAFGNYLSGDTAPRDAAGSLSIACTRGTPYSVALGPGSFAAGATRQMASGAARLAYELYSDAGRTAVWSAATPVTGTAASTQRVTLPVYGRIPALQPAPPGPYADAVVSTIDF